MNELLHYHYQDGGEPMLYDPKWSALSLDNLIAWLERQDPNGTYDFESMQDCLLGKWLKSIDPLSHPCEQRFFGIFEYVVFGKEVNLEHFCEIADQRLFNSKSRTYGGALQLARQIKEKENAV